MPAGTAASWSDAFAAGRRTAAAACAGASELHVTDGHRQRVGGVVRRRQHGQTENQLHHLLHLVLLGAAVADDRPLDLRGRVLDDRQPGLDRREHRDAARVSRA